MAEARRRAREQFGVELEHEVVLLGRRLGSSRTSRPRRSADARRRTGTRGQRGTSRARIARPRARGECRRPASAADHRRAPRSRTARPLRPLPRHRVPRRWPARSLAWYGARETGVFAVAHGRRRRRARPGHGTGASRARRRRAGRACSRSTSRPRGRRSRRSRRSRARASTAPTRTRCASSSCPSGPSPSSARAPTRTSSPRAAGSIADVERGSHPALARIWVGRNVVLDLGDTADGDLRTAIAAVAPLAGSRFPGASAPSTTTPDELTLRLRSGLEVRLGDATRHGAQARRGRPA